MYHPDSVVNLHKKILQDGSMLGHGHYSAGFTLTTYAHATNRMQEEAASRMGSYMAQNL